MTNRFRAHLGGAGAFTAIAAALALAGCNPSGSVDRSQAASQTAALPALPATLPLAPGDVTAPAYAPVAALLPAARPIRTVRVADPRESYAYADDASGFSDALGDAPPDYGFHYGNAQPWAWQGYDNSIAFVEPLNDGYRYYYYRPGANTPYFVRDPDYAYGYDNGQLAAVYGPNGGLVPYADYGPRLDYASRYYVRGRDLYQASRQRRPVVGANWAARRNAIVETRRWADARASQSAWQDYHQRTEAQQEEHWREEQARRRADTVRFAAWQGQDFRTTPPPRAIPAAWSRANWAQDQRRFAPPAAGFNGDAAARERAAMQERERVARDARPPSPQNPGAFAVEPGVQRQQPQPQGQQRADFARQQAERAQQARLLGEQRQVAQERQQQDVARQQQVQASQQAAARNAQAGARLQADRAASEQGRQRQAQANARAQGEQRAQADMQQKRREQVLQDRQQAQQRAQGQARSQEQAIQAQQRQAAETQQRAQVQAQQRQAAQAQRRIQGQAQAQERAVQAQQRHADQSQQRAQVQAQAQQRQAAQAQQRAEAQARQRTASPAPRIHAVPAERAQPAVPAAPRVNPRNGGEHRREPN
ncbi:MAG: hypothetical protein ABI240_18465 [Sphingomonas sp.]